MTDFEQSKGNTYPNALNKKHTNASSRSEKKEDVRIKSLSDLNANIRQLCGIIKMSEDDLDGETTT